MDPRAICEKLKGERSARGMWRALVSAMNDELRLRAEATEADILNGLNPFACYLSMEYLLGRLAKQTLLNLKAYGDFGKMFASLGSDIEKALDCEPSTQLGNGGLGRLAACFFDSLATLKYPAFGYGLFYRCGIYRQEIRGGRQVEKPDLWRERENFAVSKRPDIAYDIKFGGRVEHRAEIESARWRPSESTHVSANDVMLAGYGGGATLSLRLWDAERRDKRAPDIHKTITNITDFLYPPDTTPKGKRLRLRQEHVLVSASIQDMFERFRRTGIPIEKIERNAKVQLNDTHPALAVPEIIRILMQQYHFPFEAAYKKAYAMCAYTNHTLMAEALEKIGIDLFRCELPYHFAVIERIDRKFTAMAARTLAERKLPQVAIINREKRHVNTGNLLMAATHKVNGVAKLHSNLLRREEFRPFADLFPGKFINETNGITQRRWLMQANPRLANLITKTIGDGWITDLYELRRLLKSAGDESFLKKLWKIKQENKEELAYRLKRGAGIEIEPPRLLDAQVKRIHEYKRQLLNIVQVIHRYNRILDGEKPRPKTYLFAGKAPPTYEAAKDILSLINDVAARANSDRRCRGLLSVAFVPNYNIDLAESIIRAAEISEQISTAGKEASGTGNMKFALNGALTIGTLDGANVEIRREVGRRNIIIFGLTAKQVYRMKSRGYDAQKYFEASPDMQRILGQIKAGKFGSHEVLMEALCGQGDQYMLLPDFGPYLAAQAKLDALYGDRTEWSRRALYNIARSGFFSSDRSIKGYAKDIWKIKEIRK